ncbi:MAG: glycosyltransferase family 2 protein [Sphingomonadaceae bacterium]
MTVSVIIPTYNVAATVRRSIESAQGQTVSPHEIIVVDDASQDETRDVVRAMAASDPRIHLIESAVNGGPSVARNLGIDAAAGKRIALLDADDIWKPERLERMLAVMDETGVAFLADNLILYDIWADREGRLAYDASGPRTVVDARVYFANCVREKFQFSLLKPLLDREFLVENNIRYRKDVRYGEDFFYYADIFLAGARGLVLTEGYYVYTTQVGEFSGQKSPHTRSNTDVATMVARMEELETRADPATRREIRRCITSFSATHKSNAARALRQEGRYLAWARAMADKDILMLVIRLRLRRLKLRLSGQLPD